MTERPPSSRRPLRRIAAALLVALAAFHVAARDDGARWNGDAAQFTVHAENLAAGRPYAQFPGNLPNAERSLEPLAYPPGYPLMLAPVVAQTGRARAPVAVVQAACLALAVGLFVALYRRRLSAWSLGALALVLGTHGWLRALVSLGMTELPFLAATALALVAADEAAHARSRRAAWAWMALAGLAAGWATLVRTLGVLLLPALLAPAWARRDMRALRGPALAAVALAAVLAAGVQASADWEAGAPPVVGARAGTGYEAIVADGLGGRLGELPRTVAARALDYARWDREVFWRPPEMHRALHVPLRLGGLVVLVAGLVAAWRRTGAHDVFAVLYVAALLPWPFAWSRYLLPAVPILYGTLLLGAEALWRRQRALGGAWRAAVRAALAAAAVLVGAFVFDGAAQLARGLAAPPPPAEEGFDLVQAHVPERAVVLVTRPDARPLAFATGRAGSIVPYDTSAWAAYAGRVGAGFVLADEDRPLAAAWAAGRGWPLVDSTRAAHLYAAPGPAAPSAKTRREQPAADQP